MLVKNVQPKHSMVILGLVSPLEEFEKSIVPYSCLKLCKYKVLEYIQSEVTGFQSKAYQAVSRMSLAL